MNWSVLIGLSAVACSGCDNGSATSTSAQPDQLSGNETTPDVAWLPIDAGFFTFGSPIDSPCRAASNEDEVPVTLTRSFQIAATEITQAQWEALDLTNPSWTKDPNRPVTTINFFEAAAWCNKLSRLEGLDTCYKLENCENEIGVECINNEGIQFPSCGINYELAFRCTGDIHRFPDRYSCPGYRLPTHVEWEYAAKAGITETHTYGGDVHADLTLGSCSEQPALEDIAWYCNNSGDEIHPVGQKLPNPWGLYDTLGNACEWTDSPAGPLNEDFSSSPVTDPVGFPYDTTTEIRGQYFGATGCLLRPSDRMSAPSDERSEWFGFRPVRTIFE